MKTIETQKLITCNESFLRICFIYGLSATVKKVQVYMNQSAICLLVYMNQSAICLLVYMNQSAICLLDSSVGAIVIVFRC